MKGTNKNSINSYEVLTNFYESLEQETEYTNEELLDIFKRVWKGKVKDIKATDVLKDIDIDEINKDFINPITDISNLIVVAKYNNSNYDYILLDEIGGEYYGVTPTQELEELTRYDGGVDVIELDAYDQIEYISKDTYNDAIENWDMYANSYTGMDEPEFLERAKKILGESKQLSVEFPLSSNDQMKYFIDKTIDTNGTFYDIYKIDGKYYDELGNELPDYKE